MKALPDTLYLHDQTAGIFLSVDRVGELVVYFFRNLAYTGLLVLMGSFFFNFYFFILRYVTILQVLTSITLLLHSQQFNSTPALLTVTIRHVTYKTGAQFTTILKYI